MNIFAKRNSRPAHTLRLSRGFTLVELLVVIAIIGVLSTLLLLQLGTARAKARDAKRITDINGLRTALELYYDDNGGKYPIDTDLPYGTVTTEWNTTLGKYIASGKVPVDPTTEKTYNYAHSPATSPSKYHLWIELEAKNVAALAGDADINSTGWTGKPLNSSQASNDTCPTSDYSAGGVIGGGVLCAYDIGQQ